MSEHPINAINRRVVERAEKAYAAGGMGEALREAVKAAYEEARRANESVSDPEVEAKVSRDVINALYCSRPLVRVQPVGAERA